MPLKACGSWWIYIPRYVIIIDDPWPLDHDINGDENMSLGNNISLLRKQKRFTQEQFADRMRVTRQTVSKWESDEVIPELDRLVEMCEIFSCKLDALVREDLAGQNGIYSEIRIKRIAPFKMASYVIISSDPESDALRYMDRWAESCGLRQAHPDVKLIGWDFPYVSQEQQNRFGLHGYVAACVLPDDFKTDHPGVMLSENKEADYAVITIKEPFVQPFERIPTAYKLIMEYLHANNFKEKKQESVISCFEYTYQKNDVTYMDVFVHVDGVTKAAAFSMFS